MASIVEVIKSFDINSKEFELLVHDLMSNSNDLPYDSEKVDSIQNTIITAVNSRINNINIRYDGLLLLDKILFRCSKDTLAKHGLLWIMKSTQILENVHSTTQELTLACKVLGFLMEHCKEIPELHKQISVQNVKQLIISLNALKTNAKCGAVYYLLAVLLYHYPEVCEKYQNLIKKMILLQIDSTQKNMVNASAKCYILLSKATERSFKPPQNKSTYTGWTYNEVLLCNNLHTIMDELFSEMVELETVDVWDKLCLPSISKEDVLQYYNSQKQRFLNLCTYLTFMLRGYETENSILPHDTLGVVCRGLAITPLNLKNKTFKEQMLYIILPQLHIKLFTVLDAFINGFTHELIPFGKTVLQLFQQTLQWTSTVLENQQTLSNSKPFKSVKMSAYKCLSSWLKNTGSVSGIETIANQCITFILKDVTPKRDRIMLTVTKNQHLSKRAMKRFKRSQYESSPILNNGESATKNECLDADLCKEALITLQYIILNGGVLLKPTFYKSVQNTVIPLLYYFYLSPSEQSFYKNHNECRLELFKVLKALQLNPHVALTFPIQYSIEISHMATCDDDLSIAQEAKLVSVELEKIIHPVAPTLQLSRQQESDNEFVPEAEEEQVVTDIAKFGKRNRIEQDVPVSPTCKRANVTSECVKTIQNENNIEHNSTKSIEMSNNTIDLDESPADGDCENVRKSLQESEEIQCNKQQSSPDTDKIANINIEIRTECKSISCVVEEDQEQYEQTKNSSPPRNETATAEIGETTGRNPKITDEIQEKAARDILEEQEDLDSDTIESLNLFRDEVKMN